MLGSCEICKAVDLLGLCKQLAAALRDVDGRGPREYAGLVEEADEIIAAHEEEARLPDQPVVRDSAIFVAVLAAMDRAEEINGPEGDDYRRLMRAIEVEARNRRQIYDK